MNQSGELLGKLPFAARANPGDAANVRAEVGRSAKASCFLSGKALAAGLKQSTAFLVSGKALAAGPGAVPQMVSKN